MYERTLLTLQALITLLQHFIVKSVNTKNNNNIDNSNISNSTNQVNDNNGRSSIAMSLALFDETFIVVNAMNE